MGGTQWGTDAAALGRLGHGWAEVALPRVDVVLSADLAAAAVEAWERDDSGNGLVPEESPAERLARHRSGTLALIGRAVTERGRPDGDTVHVDLDAGLVALAVEASDDLPT